MEVETPREFLEQVLPARFNPEKAKGFEAVAQVNITGPQGGSWNVTIKDQKMQTKEGVDANSSITLKMKDTDFLALVNGKLNAIQAFMTGKLEFQGNMATALKLFDMGFM
jgi:putative sterol carrier protein